jgi:transcriptional regulator with XRE-family HTH domain
MDRTQEIVRQIGRRLAGRRIALKWSQEFLGEQVGVEPETISRIERGIHTPSLKSLIRLIDTLGITFSQVVQDRDDPVDEAERILRHLARLSPESRVFIADMVDQLSRHLVRMEGRSAAPLRPPRTLSGRAVSTMADTAR